MFFAYKHLVRQMRDDRKFTEHRLTQVLSDYNSAFKENTKILSELFTWLKAKNGH